MPILTIPRKSLLLAVLAFMTAGLLVPRPVAAVTPDSPEVKKCLQRALQYLAVNREERLGGGLFDWPVL